MKLPIFPSKTCQQSASLAANLWPSLLGTRVMAVFIMGWLQKNIVNATSELPFPLLKLGHPESLFPWQPKVSIPLAPHRWGQDLCVSIAEASASILFISRPRKVAFGSLFEKRGRRTTTEVFLKHCEYVLKSSSAQSFRCVSHNGFQAGEILILYSLLREIWQKVFLNHLVLAMRWPGQREGTVVNFKIALRKYDSIEHSQDVVCCVNNGSGLWFFFLK